MPYVEVSYSRSIFNVYIILMTIIIMCNIYQIEAEVAAL